EGPLPMGVQATAIQPIATVRLIFAAGEIEVRPVLRRLVRPRTDAADFIDQQPADAQGVVANQFGRKAKMRLGGQELITGIAVSQLLASLGRLPVGFRL